LINWDKIKEKFRDPFSKPGFDKVEVMNEEYYRKLLEERRGEIIDKWTHQFDKKEL
jgi:hypothetical protein